jgi:hypothetical protein
MVEPGAAIIVTPRNTLEFSYQFNKTEYDLESYPDYVSHGPNLTWFHDLMNERTRIICVLGGNWVDFEEEENEGGVRQQTWRAMAGVDHQWTEALQVTLTAGAHYTKSRFQKTEEDNRGFILDGTLNWRLEPITLSASVSRDVAPSIYGEIITLDRVSTVLGYRLSEKLRCILSTAYYHSETEGFVQEERWQTYSVRPSMMYSFTEDMNLQLGYAYTRTENEITNYSEDQNRFFVEFSAAWPITIE